MIKITIYGRRGMLTEKKSEWISDFPLLPLPCLYVGFHGNMSQFQCPDIKSPDSEPHHILKHPLPQNIRHQWPD